MESGPQNDLTHVAAGFEIYHFWTGNEQDGIIRSE
jgi:hypothetical protein